jgi:RND superfamily putative drug exporter
VLAVGNSPGADQFRAVGVGLGVGVLMDAFLVRTLRIPSTPMLLGRANWWPSRLGGPDQPQVLPPEPEPERAATPS